MVRNYNFTDSPNTKVPSVVITLSPAFRPEIIATSSPSVMPTSTTRTSTVLFQSYIDIFAVRVFANRLRWNGQHFAFTLDSITSV